MGARPCRRTDSGGARARRLNDNANMLSSKDLYGMVGIVEESCKGAVDQSNPEEVRAAPDAPDAPPHPSRAHVRPAQVEIDIDSLDLQTFLKVDRYVRDCIMRAKKKA